MTTSEVRVYVMLKRGTVLFEKGEREVERREKTKMKINFIKKNLSSIFILSELSSISSTSSG